MVVTLLFGEKANRLKGACIVYYNVLLREECRQKMMVQFKVNHPTLTLPTTTTTTTLKASISSAAPTLLSPANASQAKHHSGKNTDSGHAKNVEQHNVVIGTKATLVTNVDSALEWFPNELPSKFRLVPADLGETMGLSGSAQPSRLGFVSIVDNLLKQSTQYVLRHGILFLDLRQETHGFLQDGTPVSWYTWRDWGNTSLGQDVVALRDLYLQAFHNATATRETVYHATMAKEDSYLESVIPIGSVHRMLHFESVEVDMLSHVCQLQGCVTALPPTIAYKWIPLTDHMPPPLNVLQDVADFIRQMIATNTATAVSKEQHNLKNPTTPVQTICSAEKRFALPHIHVHCRAGDGRTTTLLVCLEMIIRANILSLAWKSLEDLLENQHAIGGIDLNAFRQAWKSPYVVERRARLAQFYNEQAVWRRYNESRVDLK